MGCLGDVFAHLTSSDISALYASSPFVRRVARYQWTGMPRSAASCHSGSRLGSFSPMSKSRWKKPPVEK